MQEDYFSKSSSRKVKENSSNVINLDGDIIRDLFEDNTNYNMESRVKQIRIQNYAYFCKNKELLLLFQLYTVVKVIKLE